MTWYASHVYAEPNSDLLGEIRSHRLLSKGLYLIQDLEGYDWDRLTSEYRHTMPEKGLLVVRELCNPKSEEGWWHREQPRYDNQQRMIIPWENIEGPTDISLIQPPFLPVYGFGQIKTDIEQEAHPPPGFLQYLKDLSQRTNSTISFYHHMSGAGYAVQQEFAWVFGSQECVYVANLPDGNDWHRLGRYYWGKSGQLQVEHITDRYNNPRYKVTISCLTATLRHLGLRLPSNHFAPHTRRFAWDKYKLD